MANDQYVIRGGIEGRERLRIIARVMYPTTAALLDQVGVAAGMCCLDVGCGGGDVTLELARRAGAGGSVLGIDLDATQLEVARAEARAAGASTVEFRAAGITEYRDQPRFDVVYCRFVLTHVPDPAAALRNLFDLVRPGGAVVLEDIDFSGHFTYPPLPAFQRYAELYVAAVRKRGGDPNIGLRLPSMLLDTGCALVRMNVVQPSGLEGEVKVINAITMRNIADVLIRDGLSTADEVDRVVDELHRFALDPRTVAGVPRIVQAWGTKSAGPAI